MAERLERPLGVSRLQAAAASAPDAGLLGGVERALRALRRQVRGDSAAVVGAALFVAIAAIAILADHIAPYDPAAVHVSSRLQPPSASYWLGTDELGRDVLSRVIFGARASLQVGIFSTLIAGLTGVLLGVWAAQYGGLVDAFIMRVVDGLLAFPSVILALAMAAVLGPSLPNVILAIGLVSIPAFARITRASVLSLLKKEFVEASRSSGATDLYLMLRVLLPNCLSPLLVQASISFGNAILFEAALSFLGLGVQPPTPAWGAMLDTGRKYLGQTPWYSIAAGSAIFVTVLSLNLLGDGLRDALDPRTKP